MIGNREDGTVNGIGAPAALASTVDTLRAASTVLAPILAEGVVRRRPRIVAATARLDTPHRAVREMRRLRARYGPGPLRLRIPGRRLALVLSSDDVHRLLAESPEPFALATRDKWAALRHFEADAVLITGGSRRETRRRVNDAVLNSACPRHRLADHITTIVRQETALLLDAVGAAGRLSWHDFAPAYWRIVRRIVLGDAARDDKTLIDMLNRLRSDANWAWLRARRDGTYQQFTDRLRAYLDTADPASLAGELAGIPDTPDTAPGGQVPHWLFAFDAAGMATLRALALLATHPDQMRRARDDHTATADHLRACILDTLRLWPTTLIVLRESTGPTTWHDTTLPAGTTFVVVSSFFHRDTHTLPYGDRFYPDIWLRDPPDSLIPFSGGPGRCPGQNLVLLVTSTILAALLDGHDYHLTRPALDPDHPLPGALDPYQLRFAVDSYPARGSGR